MRSVSPRQRPSPPRANRTSIEERQEDTSGDDAADVSSGHSPSEVPGHAKSVLALRPRQVFGLMDGRTDASALAYFPPLPGPSGPVLWRGSFPNTAAGQRRNWTLAEFVPASLLIPSLYPYKAMETLASAKYAVGNEASSHAIQESGSDLDASLGNLSNAGDASQPASSLASSPPFHGAWRPVGHCGPGADQRHCGRMQKAIRCVDSL